MECAVNTEDNRKKQGEKIGNRKKQQNRKKTATL